MAIVRRYGELGQLMTRFNPDAQGSMATNIVQTIMGDYPTLAKLKWYGENVPKAWLLPQLYDLSEFCGCKEKLQGRPLEQCADVIATTWHYLKVSELMMFFYRFKTGKYGTFYGNVDPLVITTSLAEFVKERNTEIDLIEQEQRKQQLEESLKNSITYEEWQKVKQQKQEKTK